MSARFSWVPDVTRGEWLRPMEVAALDTILWLVPAGFEAYARVFHPVVRDRRRLSGFWDTERATWAMAADAFGTTMHAEAQYPKLVRRRYGDDQGVIAPDGWRYSSQPSGNLDAVSLTLAAAVLARHTLTPDAGIAAIWDGWGGLVNSRGSARDWYVGEPPAPEDVSIFLRNTTDPEPGSGVLPRDAAAGPRFHRRGDISRTYILFEAGANDFADPDWPHRAPWVDSVTWPKSPSIIWPDDHAWVLATEIDFDFTIVAGTTALIKELQQTSGLEVLSIRADAEVRPEWDNDVPDFL